MTKACFVVASCITLWTGLAQAQQIDGPLLSMKDWSGTYVGAGVSYSTHRPRDETGSLALPSASGPSLSLIFGYAWQRDNLVLGVEAAANVGESVGSNDCCNTAVENFFLIRGRVGVATGSLVVFGTLGAVSDKWSLSVPSDGLSIRYNGIAIGTGAEVAISDRMSVRGDVEHYTFGSKLNATGDQVDYSTNLFRLSLVRSF
jgi:opacity protein-like surface antigen